MAMKNVIKLAYIDVVNVYQQDCQHIRLPVVHLLWDCSLFCLTKMTHIAHIRVKFLVKEQTKFQLDSTKIWVWD